MIEAKDIEIAALRTSHQGQLDALRAEVAALAAEVADLRARLGQNPRNSSKPPSSEGLAKPSPRSLRKKSGRRPGRPKGQPGATLEMTDHPDEVLTCEGCRRVGHAQPLAPIRGRSAKERAGSGPWQDVRAVQDLRTRCIEAGVIDGTGHAS